MLFRSTDGMVTVAGRVQWNADAAGQLRIVPLSGDWVPRGSRWYELPARLGAQARLVDVRADGLWLRGRLPGDADSLTINGTYPSVLVP